ncbi:Bifunctional ribulose 5-phosphate reductase/CDP-ribitol pyrophosphorylase Bcs1 [Pseudodesulfovibrio profundus]|uniref:2-C-methyl-D-erythritol 4-phosphate cytidylyltransferase n=1 Tax=Pseudodesulfovibrio profundus TaxID=57320 RepID=A0A2C8F8K8_9BACT|nr:2-C-methyl-D-erythritol 4-phosphate cytidylyltransferase [Pseudodesulfovibrio profundus]SOB58887.1 Bifunctional ribulose 5-phosphate reductase/CDP-ribitol pyrophosphorylase Bcs1 [Pseudodesulfovibrio profundus]
MSNRKRYCILLAAGSGNRMKFPTPKQFLKLAGRTIIEHTLDMVDGHPEVDEIFIVMDKDYRSFMEEILLRNSYTKVTKVLNGGASRRESSASGIFAVEEDDALVLLHDAVRPFLSHRIVSDCYKALEQHASVDVAIPAVDTIIKVDEQDCIQSIPDRSALRRGQTPQGFRADVLKRAHHLAMEDPEVKVTDDCGLILRYGLGDVHVVQGEERNIKITYPEDLYLADKIFQLNTVDVEHLRSGEPLEGKHIVVFGSSRGIGEHVMRMGTDQGAIMHGFSRTNGVDVRDYKAVKEALDSVQAQTGRIDGVVNTAAILRSGTLLSRDIDDINLEIDINYTGSINVVKAALPHLKESRGSVALFTSSSYTRGRSLYTIYSSTKAAVVNLTQGLAEELHADGVRINAINPERTNTPMRRENFGVEPENTLLSAEAVAQATLDTLLAHFSGMVVDVRRND